MLPQKVPCWSRFLASQFGTGVNQVRLVPCRGAPRNQIAIPFYLHATPTDQPSPLADSVLYSREYDLQVEKRAFLWPPPLERLFGLSLKFETVFVL